MKRNILFLLVVFTFVFSSCKMDDGYSEYSPILVFGNPVKLNSDSTLNLKDTYYSNVIRLDSIHVGDTVVLKVGMNAYYNQLLEFDFSVNDSSAIKAAMPDSLNYLFTSIDAKAGKYVYKSGYYAAILPLNLIAKKVSDSIEYKFNIYSDVTKVTNSSALVLRTKIKPKRALNK